MASPSGTRVKVDKEGRLALPQDLWRGLVEPPGEVTVTRTPEGLLIEPTGYGAVRTADDGLPALDLDRPVTNAEVLAAIDAERGAR